MNQEEQDAKDAKSAKKFLWILMLIPIGLGVGVILSNINFRKKEEAKADITQYRASQMFDKASLKDDMEKLLLSKDKGNDHILRQISSSLGINNYLTMRATQGDGVNLGYYDIKGSDEKTIIAVIIETDEANPVGKSALIAIPIAVIKSLAGKKNFSHTLRFVFLPKKYMGAKLDIREKDEKLKSLIIIRAGGEFSTNDPIEWRSVADFWQHPAMAYPHESVTDRITPAQVKLSLTAAQQLKKMLELSMKE